MKSYINKKSLAEEVAIRLQDQIASGQYKVNEKLPIEPELMKTFGVGRSSIREAIKLLSNAGLIRVQQGVGTFVEQFVDREPMDSRLKRANVEDLDEVRQLLEMKIAEKAALNRTDQDIEEIESHLKNRRLAAEKGLTPDCIEADIQFHIAIAKAAKNEILLDLYKAASVHLKVWFLSIHTDTAVFNETYNLHKQLLQHIKTGNSKLAWSAAAKIIGHISR